jgi:hypothetical protein
MGALHVHSLSPSNQSQLDSQSFFSKSSKLTVQPTQGRKYRYELTVGVLKFQGLTDAVSVLPALPSVEPTPRRYYRYEFSVSISWTPR